jgi:hypothetical protein
LTTQPQYRDLDGAQSLHAPQGDKTQDIGRHPPRPLLPLFFLCGQLAVSAAPTVNLDLNGERNDAQRQ